MSDDMGTLAHLEVQIKFTDNLSPLWTINGYGVDREFVSFEGPFLGNLGRDHDGRREVPRNCLSCIMMTELPTKSRS